MKHRGQVRKWTPWHRSITCTMLAHAFLAVQRAHHLNSPPALPCEEPAHTHHGADPPAPQDPPPSAPDVTMCQDSPGKTGPMIRLTVTALAGLLTLTGLAVHHSDQELLRQHHWRTEHQTAAATSH
ncbi:hypothetical protein [Kitasatospora azatica]|uniref:hypothetical protein n=1 Tax=Kitasatospora azatica TaxID=58347 RepID=UPI000A073182|nr:hypothetical protein [Kitasatospora azatica]